MSLVYWKHTPKLSCHPKPDVRYAVNMTVAALHEEFSAPGLSTISAALIDLTGRPIFSMTGNAISCGRMVSLANCLGLNRDPSNWKLSQQEKDHRIRLWWGVVIHDRWGSFGHGVPPQISKTQYDVPLPSVDGLVAPNNRSNERVKAAHCHIALCKLTEILGELLPLVYGLQAKHARESSKKIRQIRTDLDLWEDSLPEWLRVPMRHRGEQVYASSSLQLAFLAVKMLVSRVELNVRLQALVKINVHYLLTYIYRRSITQKPTTPKLAATFKLNAAGPQRKLCGSLRLFGQRTSRNSGYHVSSTGARTYLINILMSSQTALST